MRISTIGILIFVSFSNLALYAQDYNATGDVNLLNGKFIRGNRNGGGSSNLIGYELASQKIEISQYSTMPTEVTIYTPSDPGQGVSIYSDELIAFFRNNGRVGIGTRNPDSKLTVVGDIHAQEVKVDLNGAVAPDYVFEESYTLRNLREVEKYIQQYGHLPNIPSAEEMNQNGLNLKEMNLKLLEKVEELTLYLIKEYKENQKLKERVAALEKEFAQ